MRRSRDELDEPQINLTPLLDVVVVVLIMFIVVVPILELNQVALAPGNGAVVKTVGQASPLTIHVRADNTVWIGQRKVPAAALDQIAQAAHQKHPDITPQLFADKRSHFGTYQMVKNALERAGYSEMEVILEPA